jgi:NADH dehydrogenase [ubiquinone] 1 alpha subcomplex assembly factor 7
VNTLGQRIAALIASQGPISVAEFMTLANDAYYAARDPFGTAGDFITAPEISQTFGEMLGLWCVQIWHDQGRPEHKRLVELGPGRGTLMADVLRTIGKAMPEFLVGLEIALIEASPMLCEIQWNTLSDYAQAAPPHPALSPDGGEGKSGESPSPPHSGGEGWGEGAVPLRWLSQFDAALADQPLFLLANEFFDALPVRQFVKTPRGWCERMVTLEPAGSLAFALSPLPAPDTLIPPDRRAAPDGGVYELSAPALSLVEEISYVIARQGGGALIVDYGYDAPGFSETLQAVAGHTFADILDAPGENDLSAHVDFSGLAAARETGAAVFGPITQGEFLKNLGIVQRMERLIASHADFSLRSGVDRLINPEQMGTLFKVLAILPAGAAAPPGF